MSLVFYGRKAEMMRQKHSAAGAASPAVCSYFKEEFLIRGAAASGPRE